MLESIWRRSWEPPTEWVEALATVSPRSEQHGWLHLWWESGDAWDPVQRWTLYEMIPKAFVDVDILAELEGPDPRTLNRYDSVKRKMYHQTLITRSQWLLYQQTGCYGKLFWIIQGEKGGHKRSFSEDEKKLLRLRDLPTDPPTIGALGYAPFDGRVIQQITRFDRLKQFKGDLSAYRKAYGAEFTKTKNDAARSFRAQLTDWLADQVDEAGEHAIDAVRHGELENAPKTETDWVRKEEDARHQYVETGTLT